MSPDAALLDELVRRIVESVHPLQITLFGSAARGEMGPHSDRDVLVVMPDGCDRLAVTQAWHCRLSDLGTAKDIVVVQAIDAGLRVVNSTDVSGDIVERVDPVFFSDPMTAAMKALGMT